MHVLHTGAFERALIGKQPKQEFVLTNACAIPVNWKLTGVDTLPTEFGISKTTGLPKPPAPKKELGGTMGMLMKYSQPPSRGGRKKEAGTNEEEEENKKNKFELQKSPAFGAPTKRRRAKNAPTKRKPELSQKERAMFTALNARILECASAEQIGKILEGDKFWIFG